MARGGAGRRVKGHLSPVDSGSVGRAVGTAGEVSGGPVHRGAGSPFTASDSWWVITIDGQRPSPPMRGPWAALLVQDCIARGVSGVQRRTAKPDPPDPPVHLATHITGLSRCGHRIAPQTRARAEVTCWACLEAIRWR